MIHQSILVSSDQLNHDVNTDSRDAERALNAAIIRADISRSFEEYLEIFDTFYADDIEATSDTGKEPFRGKERVRAALLNLVAGLSVSIRETAIPGDAVGETHSAWTLELIGTSGKTCSLNWRIFRKWEGAQVVCEHHYDQRQSGGPLTVDDLSPHVSEPGDGLRRAS